MDNFLKQQKSGELVDGQNAFTIDRRRSRKKVLDRAVYEQFMNRGQHNDGILVVKYPLATPEMKEDLLDELRRPFGEWSGASLLARAIYRGVELGSRVSILWNDNLISLGFSNLELTKDRLTIPDSIQVGNQNGLRIRFYPASGLGDFTAYYKLPARKLFKNLEYHERLLPLEAASNLVLGYFDYRTKPFTAVRSYALCPPDSKEEEKLVEQVTDRLRGSSLIKRSYTNETVEKIQAMWGRA